MLTVYTESMLTALYFVIAVKYAVQDMYFVLKHHKFYCRSTRQKYMVIENHIIFDSFFEIIIKMTLQTLIFQQKSSSTRQLIDKLFIDKIAKQMV